MTDIVLECGYKVSKYVNSKTPAQKDRGKLRGEYYAVRRTNWNFTPFSLMYANFLVSSSSVI